MKLERTDIYVRQARREDLPSIHALVRELAIYERAEKEFIASIEEYEQDFDRGGFQALVAEVEGEVVGMALYYLAYSTWKGKMLFLEDFVVRQAYRRRGIGQRLFDAFLREAQAMGCRLVKWQVLDWNEPALRFYEQNEALIERDWWNGKLFLHRAEPK